MIEYKTEMVRCSDKHMTLHFTQRVGTTIRHATVSIPLETLVQSASVCDGLERATRRLLIEHWSGLEIPDEPLF